MEKGRRNELLASCGLLLATIIWGFAFVVVKNSLNIIPPIYMVAIRFSIAFIAMSLIFIKKYSKMNKKLFMQGAVLGFWLFASYATQTIGCNFTTAGKNAFITTVYVVLVPLLYWFFAKKKPDIFEIVSAIAAFLGIGLLSVDEAGKINIGDLLTFLCGIGFAIHMIFVAIYNKKCDPIILVILQTGFTAVFAWLFAPMYDGAFSLGQINADGVIAMLYLGLLSTMTAYFLQNVGQKYVPASKAALIMSFESVFGALFSIIFLSEPITFKTLIGCLIIFGAVITAETKLEFLKINKKNISA